MDLTEYKASEDLLGLVPLAARDASARQRAISLCDQELLNLQKAICSAGYRSLSPDEIDRATDQFKEIRLKLN